jgi:hypothetical protein
MNNVNINLKCECCKIYIAKNEEYRDENIIYCLQCVQSKKMDEDDNEMDNEMEWNYCENCRNLVMEEDFVGNCHIQIKCKESIKNKIKINEYYSRGYTHLCKNCCTVINLKNEQIIKCILE